ncbi:MAG TPA: aldo/keto reductase [Magnetospirillaceae bacterium]|jgi:diketogulonate reductase-like aldo/keto reductase
MQQRRFGSVSRPVPVIGQGTWNMEGDDKASVLAALRRGIELGMTHIDTAELYGSGRVETLVAPVIAECRDDLFLVSKVMPTNASKDGTTAACEKSLKRLGTDRLDCYLLHWPGRHPLADTIEAFERLMDDGKILAWGLSNFDERGLDAALKIAGPDRIACNQVLYHLEERAIEHAVIPWCEKNGVAVVAYSPFGSGSFPDPKSEGGRVLARIASAHRATIHQVALAFLTRSPSVLTIPKASRRLHAEDNAGAGDLQLTDADIAALDAAFPRGHKRGLPMI